MLIEDHEFYQRWQPEENTAVYRLITEHCQIITDRQKMMSLRDKRGQELAEASAAARITPTADPATTAQAGVMRDTLHLIVQKIDQRIAALAGESEKVEGQISAVHGRLCELVGLVEEAETAVSRFNHHESEDYQAAAVGLRRAVTTANAYAVDNIGHEIYELDVTTGPAQPAQPVTPQTIIESIKATFARVTAV